MPDKVQVEIEAVGDGQAKQALKSTKQEAENLQHGVSGIGTVARGVLAADLLTQIGESAKRGLGRGITAASDLGESVNAVNKIFGDSAGEIQSWGKTNANAFGLSQRAFNQMAVPIGASLKNVGLDMDMVAQKTLELTERASDMGSVFNHDVGEVLTDIQAGLRGEMDPLEKYGVGLSAAAVQQKALAMTGKEVASELTNQEIMLARVQLLLDQTADSAGDFKDTSDGYANAQRIANAQMEEASAIIGANLLPAMAGLASMAANVAEALGSLPSGVQALIIGALGLAAAFVFLAPKIIASIDAFKTVKAAMSEADGSFNKTAAASAKLAAVLTTVGIAGHLLGSMFATDVKPQVDLLAVSMENYAKTGKLAGEISRLFNDDMAELGRTLGYLADDPWSKFSKATAEGIEGFLGIDVGAGKAKTQIDAIDAALAKMVQEGNQEAAAIAFKRLAEHAANYGVSTDALIRGLPQYAAEQERTKQKTQEHTTATENQVVALKNLHDALLAQSNPMFALIEAQNNLTEKQKAYTEALERHGPKAQETKDALREVAQAAIEMTGAAQGAQGSFDGKLSPAMVNAMLAAGMTKEQIAQLEAQFNAARAAGDAFAKSYNATVTVTYREQGRAVPITPNFQSGIGGKQSGGLGSGLVIAGEGGVPELVNLGASGRVYNGAETQSMLRKMGGGMPSEITVKAVLELIGGHDSFRQFMQENVKIYGAGITSKAYDEIQ